MRIGNVNNLCFGGSLSSLSLAVVLYQGNDGKPAMKILRLRYDVDGLERRLTNADRYEVSTKDAETEGFWRIESYLEQHNLPSDSVVHVIPIAQKFEPGDHEYLMEHFGRPDPELIRTEDPAGLGFFCQFAAESMRETGVPGVQLVYDSQKDRPQELTQDYLRSLAPDELIDGKTSAERLLAFMESEGIK